VTNVGEKPTFVDTKEITVETHIFDFDKDIYGESIKVAFIDKIRDEKKFDSVNHLIQQITLDIKKCKDYFQLVFD